MKFGITSDKFDEIYHKPHYWFAWYPVQLESGEWVWWEIVTRQSVGAISKVFEYFEK